MMRIFQLSSDDAPLGFYKPDFNYKGVRVRVRVSTNPTLTLFL